jgi:uncharacterized damage-inducible protein DinB
METLAAFLTRRAERSFRYLLLQLKEVTPEMALRDAHPDWPDHRWGIGQDGSIAGIVYHLAAWKRMTLPMLHPEGKPLTRDEFDFESAPASDDWAGILAWLKQIGTAWQAELARLPDVALDETREWEGETMPLAKIVVEMMEHDVYHTGQIEYLKQRFLLSS